MIWPIAKSPSYIHRYYFTLICNYIYDYIRIYIYYWHTYIHTYIYICTYHIISYHIFSLFKFHRFLMMTSLWHGGITAAPVRSSLAKIPRRRRLLRRICCAECAEWRWPPVDQWHHGMNFGLTKKKTGVRWVYHGLPSSKIYDINC
jgi:hypothetical protein